MKIRQSQVNWALLAALGSLAVVLWLALVVWLMFAFAQLPWNVVSSLVVFVVPIAVVAALWAEDDEHKQQGVR